MRVCVMQMDVVKGGRETNYETVRRLTEEAMRAARPPEVIVLPELWSTGYALVYNRAQIIDREGRYAAGYDKIHLFRLMDEDRYLAQGKEALWFELGGMRCAAAICYDIRFCELIRKLAVGGAEALFVSAEWPLPRREHWVTLLRARAIENQMYVVACNRCGVTGQEVFGGNSLIVAPDGTVLAQADAEEDIICADLDPDFVRQTRCSGIAFLLFTEGIPFTFHRRSPLWPESFRARCSPSSAFCCPRAGLPGNGIRTSPSRSSCRSIRGEARISRPVWWKRNSWKSSDSLSASCTSPERMEPSERPN